VRRHHSMGFLDPQVECVSHTLGNVSAQSAKTTRQGAPGLRLAFLDALARLECGDQLLF
jgi:hypothetical protein